MATDERRPGPGMVFAGRAARGGPVDLFAVKSVNQSKHTVTLISDHGTCHGTYTVHLDRDGLLSDPDWRRIKVPRDIKPYAEVYGRSGVDPETILR